MRRGEALFAFDLETDALDDAGRSAVADALGGRLAALQAAARGIGTRDTDCPHRHLRTRERRTAWRFNLLGIVNVSSVAEAREHGLALGLFRSPAG